MHNRISRADSRPCYRDALLLPSNERAPEDICSVHVEHNVRLVLLEGAMHLIQQTLVAANIDSRRLQARCVDELHPDTSHSTSDDPNALGGRLKGIGRSSLILTQHAVDGSALAHSSHANDHHSAGEGQGLVRMRRLLGFSCADGCFKSIGTARIAAGLGDADALCQVQPAGTKACTMKLMTGGGKHLETLCFCKHRYQEKPTRDTVYTWVSVEARKCIRKKACACLTLDSGLANQRLDSTTYR